MSVNDENRSIGEGDFEHKELIKVGNISYKCAERFSGIGLAALGQLGIAHFWAEGRNKTMLKMKKCSRTMSILFVTLALMWPSVTGAQTQEITYSSANFGDVVVKTEAEKIVTVTYNGEVPYSFIYDLPINPCGFTASGDNYLALSPARPSTEIYVKWEPSEPGQCSADLKILNGRFLAALITVTGIGVNQTDEKPNTKLLLSSFDNWVESGALVGSGPGKSAANRLNAFRNMLVEADNAVEQERIAEAYGQLSAARKKIGQFIQDGAGMKTMSMMSGATATSATKDLEGLMNQVMESLSR